MKTCLLPSVVASRLMLSAFAVAEEDYPLARESADLFYQRRNDRAFPSGLASIPHPLSITPLPENAPLDHKGAIPPGVRLRTLRSDSEGNSPNWRR